MNTGSPPPGRWPATSAAGGAGGRLPPMTATDARTELRRLEAERLEAVRTGLEDNPLYMDDLERDIETSRAAYVGLAVTEIATLRAQLSGPQVG